jgi:hypothetical protein
MKWWPGEVELLRDGVWLHGILQAYASLPRRKRSLWQAACFAYKVLSITADFDVIDCQNFPYFLLLLKAPCTQGFETVYHMLKIGRLLV